MANKLDPNKPDPNISISIPVLELATLVGQLCADNSIDLAGFVSLPCVLPHGDKWLQWVADGRHGDLDYLSRDPEGRINPTLKNPWAKTVLVFGQRYTDGWHRDDSAPMSGFGATATTATTTTATTTATRNDIPWTDRVSRYARGYDYHDVLLKDIRQVLRGLSEKYPQLVAYPSTDTGPYLEREYAWLAGLGFLGKNNCLINEKLGSGLFLGVALTNMELGDDNASRLLYSSAPKVTRLLAVSETATSGLAASDLLPPVSRCGSCTRCLDSCPTNALNEQTGLDAGRCLSTWTIEWQGQTPAGENAAQGGILFGCDICQAVCPWNHRASEIENQLPFIRAEYATLTSHQELNLEDLLTISDEEFRIRFRKTPVWRCHPEGLRRNARTVCDNIAGPGGHKNG